MARGRQGEVSDLLNVENDRKAGCGQLYKATPFQNKRHEEHHERLWQEEILRISEEEQREKQDWGG